MKNHKSHARSRRLSIDRKMEHVIMLTIHFGDLLDLQCSVYYLQRMKMVSGHQGTYVNFKMIQNIVNNFFIIDRMTSVTGRPLSSPRDVSVELFADVDRPHEYLNLMVMQFGQLIAHDITQSAVITLGIRNIIENIIDSYKTAVLLINNENLFN